jgi:hypothetical protein
LPGSYAQRLASQGRLMLGLLTRSPRSRPSWLGGCVTTPATATCSRSGASARSWSPCSSPRSATSPLPDLRHAVLLSGLTPRHYELDRAVHRGHISKPRDTLVRWAAVEAIQRQTDPRQERHRRPPRRGRPETRRSLPRDGCSRSSTRVARRPGALPHPRGRGMTNVTGSSSRSASAMTRPPVRSTN